MKQWFSLSCSVRLIVGLGAALSLGACHAQTRIDGIATANVTPDGRFMLQDANGRPLPQCQLCDANLEQKYGKACKGAPASIEPPLCQGASMATLNNLDQVLVIRTHVNPYCYVFYQAGKMYQGPCYCYAGETPPPNIKCVNR
jgi:hypothetical protein